MKECTLIFFFLGIIAISESSQPDDPSRRIQISQSVRHMDLLPPIVPSLYKSSVQDKKA